MAVMLSDDEAVAIAAQGGVVWSMPLPTVNVQEPREVSAAMARGVRSLRLRGLLSGEAGQPELAEELRGFARGAQSTPGLMAQVVRNGARPVPLGGGVVASAVSGEEAFVDLISASGVHDFAVLPLPQAQATLLTYLRTVFESGPAGPDAPPDAELWVSVGRGQGRISLKRGTVRVGDGEPVLDWGQAEAELAATLTSVLPVS